MSSPKNIKETYYVRSEINQRDNNEDSFLAFQFSPSINQTPITVLAIADGMGGHQHGEHISTEGLRRFSRALFEALAVEKSLNSAISPVISTENIAQALESALEQTNAYINRMVEANKWNKAGSTIVVAVIYDKSAVITNLGDSLLYHFQKKKWLN
ncbi:MAG: protein phosphatase 2C domain-containing protein [Blastocatellia bacterium]